MMKNLFLTLSLGLLFSSSVYADNHLKDRAAKSKQVVQQFMKQLKGELGKAMKTGGPVNAIQVCNIKAPEIAQQLSDQYGWTVARTSLKTRNPHNAPDSWESKVLNEFENRKASGEQIKPMAYFAEVDNGSDKQFRFMKAIPTGEVCLKCHGQNISANVKAKLDELYPADKARGYSKGDIRGAFTITQPM